MPDKVSFKYTLTEEDYACALRAYLFSQRGVRVTLALIGIGVSCIAILLVFDAITIGRPRPGLLPIGGWLVAIVVLGWIVLGMCQRKAASKSPFVGIEFEVQFSPEGLAARSSLGTSETIWSIYTSARETADFILLCSGTNLFYPYPKAAFVEENELQRFRDLIRANVPKAKLLDRSSGK